HPDAEIYRSLWQVLNQQIKLLEILRVRMEGLIDAAPIDWKKAISTLSSTTQMAAEAALPGRQKETDKAAEQVWLAVQGALRKLLNTDPQLSELVPDHLTPPAPDAAWLDQTRL